MAPSSSSPRPCHIHPRLLSDMEVMPFPHLASLAYFQSSTTPRTTPILRPEPPTPRKMLSESLASSPVVNRQRCYSGIPRPTSGSSRRATSSTFQSLVPGELPTVHVTPISNNPSHIRPQRLDSLQSCSNYGPQYRDLSGIRQQLHVRNFSIQHVQGPEALSSPCSTALRSLMRPLGPPLPRSHTTGNIALDREASFPIRNEQKSERLKPRRSDASPEIDVVDALHESRMTREEVALLNQIEKEKELNKARLRKTAAPTETASSPGYIAQVKWDDEIESSSLLSPGAAMSRALIREHMRRKTADGGALRIDPALANASRAPRTSLPTPKSALSIVSSPDEIDPRHVYFPEPLTYWTGRYVALCDKSKTKDVARRISHADNHPASDDGDEEQANAQHEPFETVERRRMRSVLEDLRSYCQSEKALRSFEKFERSLLTTNSGDPTASNKPAAVATSTMGTVDILTPSSKSRHPWLFGSTSSATSACNRIINVPKTTSSNKALSSADKAGGLVKSKTTGNLAATEYQVGEGKVGVIGSAALSSSKTQHIRQPSNLSIRAQMNARALREREERAARRVDETKRRVSSRSISGTTAPAQTTKRKTEKAHNQPSSEIRELLRQEVKLSSPVSGKRNIDLQHQARRPSVVTIPSLSGSDERLVNTCESHNVSITSPGSQALSEDEASTVVRQESEQRELRRRTNRQSSGDMLKSMVTVGLKGVRRMGRSLTGRSELDELRQAASRVVSGSDLGEKRWMSRSDEVGAAL